MYDVSKYNYYVTEDSVIAVSTYAGKKVRGVAKCNPKDKFDVEKGKELAAARVTYKVAKKRIKNAERLLKEAQEIVAIANRREDKMKDYLRDAIAEFEEAFCHLEKVQEKL